MAGTLVANTINTDTGLFSTNNAYNGIAKAWVQFAGSTGTIAGSFNVSSITRTSTGFYTVNFTTAMSNANYASAVSVGDGLGSGRFAFANYVPSTGGAPTTTAFYMGTSTFSGAPADYAYTSAIIFD